MRETADDLLELTDLADRSYPQASDHRLTPESRLAILSTKGGLHQRHLFLGASYRKRRHLRRRPRGAPRGRAEKGEPPAMTIVIPMT